MKNSFILRAPTVDGGWFTFKISDGPALISSHMFVVLGIPHTPIMYKDVYRGDYESGLFEGDIIYCENTEWLVCYDRGFYAINKEFQVKYLFDLKDWECLGIKDHGLDFPVNYARRMHHLFKCGEIIFNLWAVQAKEGNTLAITNVRQMVDADSIHQECGALYKNVKLFMGNTYDGKTVELHGGRLSYVNDGKYFDFISGGELIGYIPTINRGD